MEGADEDELYGVLHWLFARQGRIEQKLAARHLSEGAQVLYDVSSSYYEGHTYPLMQFGHDRDGKPGTSVTETFASEALVQDGRGAPVCPQDGGTRAYGAGFRACPAAPTPDRALATRLYNRRS